jgi:hypothetical protein
MGLLAIDDTSDSGTTNHGNSYHDLCISGHARVHAGNVYNSFYNSFQEPATAPDGLHLSRPRPSLQAATLCQASCALLVALLGALEQLCLLVRGAVQQDLVNRSLQEQIKLEVAVFEDALGSTFYIDIRIIGDWDSFNYLLTRAFRNKEGSWRLANSKYRLCQRSKSDRLLHPLCLPPFLEVFGTGAHVQMSMHFYSYEISNDKCARCGLMHDQDLASLTVERTCSQCKFIYRSDILTGRDYWSPFSLEWLEKIARVKRETPAREVPGYFHRISIERVDEPTPQYEMIIQHYNSMRIDPRQDKNPWILKSPCYKKSPQATSKAFSGGADVLSSLRSFRNRSMTRSQTATTKTKRNSIGC